MVVEARSDYLDVELLYSCARLAAHAAWFEDLPKYKKKTRLEAGFLLSAGAGIMLLAQHGS